MTLRLLRTVRAHLRRPRGWLEMRLGRVASLTPLCANFGYSRGTPVDRYYIGAFLAASAGDVRGHVLEVKDDAYSRRFGGQRITRQDVMDIDPANVGATIVGDLAEAGSLPEAAFDCIILTQTLQFVFDLPAGIRTTRAALRPGGVLLVTVPGISPIERGKSGEGWCWSFTAAALRGLLNEAFDEQNVEVTSYGNLFAATAFLHGAALEEVDQSKLESVDEAYPVLIAARARA